MASLTIRNLSPEIKEALRIRAAKMASLWKKKLAAF